ncbi:MAG TPA: TrmH family RNA methyltransferase [Mycobacteriales bacterium]|nr:TrmH family RNA methyltransferase [Mycobacteriales bacterium]
MSGPLTETGIKRLNRGWRRATGGRLRVVLADLSNPYNVGAVFRTAAVLGVDHLYLTGSTPGPAHAGVAKVALGTAAAVPHSVVATVAEAVAAARADGFAVHAVELAADAVPLSRCAFGPDTCLVLGNEAHGLSRAALAACDSAVYIPQVGKVASLNVATAAAIAMFEVRRQEWSALPDP